MKHVKLIMFVALVLLCAACLERWMEEPTFILKEVTVTSFSATGAQVTLDLDVQNTNRFDLKLDSLAFKFYLQERELGAGTMQRPVTIQASRTARLRIPLQVSYNHLGGSFKEILTGRDIPYRFTGQAFVKMGIAHATLPFSKEGRINLDDFFRKEEGVKFFEAESVRTRFSGRIEKPWDAEMTTGRSQGTALFCMIQIAPFEVPATFCCKNAKSDDWQFDNIQNAEHKFFKQRIPRVNRLMHNGTSKALY